MCILGTGKFCAIHTQYTIHWMGNGQCTIYGQWATGHVREIPVDGLRPFHWTLQPMLTYVFCNNKLIIIRANSNALPHLIFKSFLPGSETKLHLIGECNQPDWRRHHSDHQNTQIKGQNVVWAVLGFQPPSSVFATHLLTMVLTIWRPLSKTPATDQADFSLNILWFLSSSLQQIRQISAAAA